LFELYDRDTGRTLISKRITNGTSAGQCTVTLIDSDTINLNVTFYSYALYLIDDTLSKLPLYTGFDYETSGYAEVVEADFGYLKSSVILNTFSPVVGSTSFTTGFTSIWGSIITDANPLSNDNIALHSIAVYCTNYTGSFQVVGTLANDVSPTIDTFFQVNLEGETSPVVALSAFTGIKFYNFYGVFKKIQVLYMPDQINNTGTFDQVLYRF
jgi:hypothetical protein